MNTEMTIEETIRTILTKGIDHKDYSLSKEDLEQLNEEQRDDYAMAYAICEMADCYDISAYTLKICQPLCEKLFAKYSKLENQKLKH